MGQPYVGEIRMFAGNFAPSGWSLCDGSTLAIADNDVLFNLIGTTYGGDGQTTFQLPDLRGRAPLHQGSSFVIGQKAGVETVTLSVGQIPQHTHVPLAANAAGSNPSNSPQNNYWSNWTGGQYNTAAPSVSLAGTAVGAAGGSQPHDNMPPYLVINYIISLFGVFPTQN